MATKRKGPSAGPRTAKGRTTARAKKSAPAKKARPGGMKPADGRLLVREVQALDRLVAKRYRERVADLEIGGIRYAAFAVAPQRVARELRQVKSDKADIYFVGKGRVDWRSRTSFRVEFREPPLAGDERTRFASTKKPGSSFHELSLAVGGFGVRRKFDYDIYFGDSTKPHDPSIIIDPPNLFLMPQN